MNEEIVLENFPATLEWLKKTSEKYKFSGSYSKNHMFIEHEFCYRMWLVKKEEDEKVIKELHVASWIKPPLQRLEEGKIGFKEEIFDFNEDGLAGAKDHLIKEIELNYSYLA